MQLLDALDQVSKSMGEYSQRELRRKCSDGSFAKTVEGNTKEVILQNLESYRQDLYSHQENAFFDELENMLGSKTAETTFGWITGEFKENMSIRSINERKAVLDGALDIDTNLESMCAF